MILCNLLQATKPECPEKNLSEQRREPTMNSTHMAPLLGFEPGPHWWEVSAFTTAPCIAPHPSFKSQTPLLDKLLVLF